MPDDLLKTSSKFVLKANFNPNFYILDKNNIETFLGRGGFGDVYRAKLKDNTPEMGLPEEVAVKSVMWKVPKGYELTEWNFLKRGFDLKHKNLVELFYLSIEVVRDENFQQIYMELCEDELNRYIERREVSLSDIKHALTGVLRGLQHLHHQNIIHRDVKPQNILLKRTRAESSFIIDMVVKLTDLNIMKLIPDENTSATNTAGMGSRGFCAPEVLLIQEGGKTKYGTSCDVWSVGVLAYKLRTKTMFASEHDIRAGALNFQDKLKNVPEKNLQMFLTECLKLKPKVRETCQGLLCHNFLTEQD